MFGIPAKNHESGWQSGRANGWPLHAERIADVKPMVNRTQMKEQVHFVFVLTNPANGTVWFLRSHRPAYGLHLA